MYHCACWEAPVHIGQRCRHPAAPEANAGTQSSVESEGTETLAGMQIPQRWTAVARLKVMFSSERHACWQKMASVTRFQKQINS